MAEQGVPGLAVALADKVRNRDAAWMVRDPFSPDTIRWRRAAIVELRKLGIEL